ncbi:hypothetical protein AVEN_223805-1 [Araneus ventricosus]|uniref:Uncharacterized protein n=1 Tax=Araneus ventricosus TaxID=182803 RepID=A0A4Y2DKF8_ARAVE|nr:hypothetical protein AVEN_223805-1 [Araneus ventricosus]
MNHLLRSDAQESSEGSCTEQNKKIFHSILFIQANPPFLEGGRGEEIVCWRRHGLLQDDKVARNALDKWPNPRAKLGLIRGGCQAFNTLCALSIALPYPLLRFLLFFPAPQTSLLFSLAMGKESLKTI